MLCRPLFAAKRWLKRFGPLLALIYVIKTVLMEKRRVDNGGGLKGSVTAEEEEEGAEQLGNHKRIEYIVWNFKVSAVTAGYIYRVTTLNRYTFYLL